MSRLTERLFRPPLRRRAMSGGSRAVYLLLGALAGLSLATAYWSPHQILHQVLTSAGIYGMVLLGAASDIRRRSWRIYRQRGLLQDAAVSAVWTVLLFIWILDPRS